MDTRHIEARGLTVVSDIVQVVMQCGWQSFDHLNDNGIDGVIIERRDGGDTGTLYYVQIKCGRGYLNISKKRIDFFELNVGSKYISIHRERWDRLKEPVILIYVDFETKGAWWTNLKSENSYCLEENKSIILVPRSNSFNLESLKKIRRLRSYYDIDRVSPVLRLHRSEHIQDSFKETSKVKARRFYRKWSTSDKLERSNGILGEVIVSRVGWRPPLS